MARKRKIPPEAPASPATCNGHLEPLTILALLHSRTCRYHTEKDRVVKKAKQQSSKKD